MSSPVRIGNFFSSFDTEAVITQLTQARQTAITRLQDEQSVAASKKSTLASLQTRFSTLVTKLNALTTATSVSAKTASVTGTGVSAAASPTSAVGTFTVDVGKLATGTSLIGTSITAAINQSAPLSQSNFGITPSNGTFTIATATGGSATIKVGSKPLDSAAMLDSAGLATAVTAGTFTLATATGGSTTITVDPTTQSMQDVVNAINATAVGITASVTNDANGRPNMLSLSSTQGDITVGVVGDTSNFLTATSLTGAVSVAGAGTMTKTGVASVTKQMSLSDVITDINASGVGITASVTNDANGRANILSLTSTQGAISLGNVNDTSNFLRATNVLASPGTDTRVSTVGMARLNPTLKLQDESFAGGPPATGAQSFTINGTTITYDAANDSLADVIDRVNASAAGVTARYDSLSDTVKLTQAKSGSFAISMSDDGSGNLLSRMGLVGTLQTLGTNAEYSINGGPTQYSDTNTTTAPGGVTLTLSAVTTVGAPAVVSVTRDTSAAVTAVNGFVTEYNNVMTAIDAATKADKDKPGVLSGDASLRQLKSSMRGLVTAPGIGISGSLKSLGDIGLSFGAIGSAVGSTNTLQLDQTKFLDKLNTDPTSVQNVLSTFVLTPTLAPGGTGSITGLTGNYAGTQAGTYAITDDGAGLLTAAFSPSNGGSTTTTTAVVTAGGTNTGLIPGMTLTLASLLQAGTHTISVAATGQSSVSSLRALVDSQAGSGGILSQRQDTYTKVISDLSDRMDSTQKHIDNEMDQWRKKFAAMEQANAKYQSIAASLTSLQAQQSKGS